MRQLFGDQNDMIFGGTPSYTVRTQTVTCGGHTYTQRVIDYADSSGWASDYYNYVDGHCVGITDSPGMGDMLFYPWPCR
jgi:hypothetical protein